MKKTAFFIILIILTPGINAQDSKTDRLSYSFSWTPIYYGPNSQGFNFNDILPLGFEANINYRILNRISVSSGIGYQGWHRSYIGWFDPFDSTKSNKMQSNTIRIPVQINYYILRNNSKITPYLKAEIVNEFGFNKSSFFEDDILASSDSFRNYSVSANIGLGNYFNISKSIAILTECSFGTYLYADPFNSYQIKLKLGILIR